ncbi:MAG: nickel-dependent hydrogenase large subunit, partial [Desulfurococcaceae archaeon]
VVETIYCIEKMLELLEDPDIVSKETVDLTGEPRYEGVGVIEAPRGILIHHYKADDRLIATHVNIITPTTFNNTAINVELKKVVKNVLKNREIDRNVLNKIEIDIRAYDPCNSCAAHLFNLENNTFKILVIDPFRKEKNTVFIKIT